MMKNILLLFLVVSVQMFGQDVKFGVVAIKELEETEDVTFPEAHAKIIFRGIEYEYGEDFYVFERYKIYDKEGFDYAKRDIDFNNISDIEAVTYNLEDGQIVATQTPNSGIFKEKVDEDNEVTKITFPNVKEGSVLDIKYKVSDLRLRSISVQESLPIKTVNVLFKKSTRRDLKVSQNPLSGIVLKSDNNSLGLVLRGLDIAPLKTESFVTNMENYRGRLNIELVGGYGSIVMESWKDVARMYNNSNWFGKQLKRKKYFQYDLVNVLGSEMSPLERAKKIYYFVQNRMTWNEYYSRGTDDIKEAYQEKHGSIAEINFIVTAMMRKAGLNANPLLTASQSRGYVLSPTAEQFNATITALEIGEDVYILDASRKSNAFGELSDDLINGNALIVYEKERWKLIPTSPTSISTSFVIANITIDPETDGISGNFKNRIDGYLANKYRRRYVNKTETSYLKNIEKDNNLLTLSRHSTVGVDDVKDPITIEADFEQEAYVENINGDLYINPMFIFGSQVDNFTDNYRKFPIDFRFPYHKVYKINFDIPEGYVVKSVLDSKSLSMPDDIASIKYNNSVANGKIQISLDFKINYSLLGANYYEGLKSIFTEYYKISTSKIVLTKKIN